MTISLATFGLGWHFAPKPVATSIPLPPKKISPKRFGPIQYSHLSAGDLASLKARLVKAEKIPGGARHERAVLDIIAGLDASAVKDLLDDFKAKRPIDFGDAAYNLVDRWAELDPQAALEWSRNYNDRQDKNNFMEQVLKDWSAQNPADALAALRALPAGLQAAQLEGYVSQYNPARTLYSDVYSAWASTDPTAAAADALNLPPNSTKDQSLVAVARAWADQDPAAALAWSNTLPAGSAKNSAVDAAIQAMSKQDPQTAAAAASNLPDTQDRDGLMATIASNWADQDPVAALTWADQSLTGASQNNAINMAFITFCSTDPAGAANYYLSQVSNPNMVHNTDAFMVAFNWAGQDSQGAINWAMALPAGTTGTSDPTTDLRNEILRVGLIDLSDNDPVAAASYLQQNLASDPNFSQLSSQLVLHWSKSDPQAALTWAQSLPPSDAQSQSVSTAVTQLATIDPQTALNDALQLTGDTQNKTIGSVFASWAGQQPNQAVAALATLPAGEGLDSATASVAQSWLNTDPAAASQWIDTLSPGSARDGAVSALISTIGSNDPASAYNWAVTIGDPTERDTQVVNLAKQWSAKDPAAAATAAQNALNFSNLTNSQRATLQKIANPATSN